MPTKTYVSIDPGFVNNVMLLAHFNMDTLMLKIDSFATCPIVSNARTMDDESIYNGVMKMIRVVETHFKGTMKPEIVLERQNKNRGFVHIFDLLSLNTAMTMLFKNEGYKVHKIDPRSVDCHFKTGKDGKDKKKTIAKAKEISGLDLNQHEADCLLDLVYHIEKTQNIKVNEIIVFWD
jgi:hypothetical protein